MRPISFSCIALLWCYTSNAYQSQIHHRAKNCDRFLSRRSWIVGTLGTVTSSRFLPNVANAAAPPDTSVVDSIQEATKTLQLLLDNWENAVIDCRYADVPRELLETKNKQELLEKASTFALFDKSVSVVTCKTNNKNIRDYLGKTGKGPVVGLEKKLEKAVRLVGDPDDLDNFVVAIESIQQSLSKAGVYSYTAGSDYNAINNFEKEETADILKVNANLIETKQAIQAAVDGLNLIIAILRK